MNKDEVMDALNPQTKEEKQRTHAQNRALHLMFTQLADQLNESGFDMRKTLRQDIEISWSGDLIKEYLWRPVQKAQLGKESTTELTTKDIDVVFETLARHLSSKLGIVLDFPSIETIIMKQRTNRK